MAVAANTFVAAVIAVVLLSAGALTINALLGDSEPSAKDNQPATPTFTISGRQDVPLAPGKSGPLDLTLTNPHGQHMSVTALSAQVTSIDAPGRDADRPCALTDFAVDQFSGEYPIRVAAAATQSLSDLGVTTAQMPLLRMLNTDANQDGCKNATLTLTYAGTAEETH